MSPIASLILNLTLFCGLPLIIFIVLARVRQTVIMEHERGILYQNGKIRRILEPGRH